MIGAGKKNRTVTINSTSVSNTKGDWTDSTTSQGNRYAHRRAVGQRETFVSDQRYADADYVFEFTSDTVTRAIDATYELVDDSVTYEVTAAIDPDGMNREVWVYAKRKE